MGVSIGSIAGSIAGQAIMNGLMTATGVTGAGGSLGGDNYKPNPVSPSFLGSPAGYTPGYERLFGGFDALKKKLPQGK